MEMRREQVLTNNLLPTDMILKLFLIHFLAFKLLEMHIQYVDQRYKICIGGA